MLRRVSERTRALLTDLVTTGMAWGVYYWIRIKSGLFPHAADPDFWVPLIAVAIFWLIVFFLSGLYRSWYSQSRFDEFTSLFKATTFGILFLFFAIFIDDSGIGSPVQSRMLIVVYWALILGFVGGGRLLQHTFQRRLLEAGIGLRNTLVVGWSEKARELFDRVQMYHALGHRIVAFVPAAGEEFHDSYKGVPVLHSMNHLPGIIDENQIKDVLIALDSAEHNRLLAV